MDPKWVDVFPIEHGGYSNVSCPWPCYWSEKVEKWIKMIPFESWQTTSSIKVFLCSHWGIDLSNVLEIPNKKLGESGPWQSAKHLPTSASRIPWDALKKGPSQKSFPMTARFWVSNRFRFPRMSSYISNTKRLAVEVFCSGLELARYIVDMKDVMLKESKCSTVHDYHMYCCEKHEIQCIICRICVWY